MLKKTDTNVRDAKMRQLFEEFKNAYRQELHYHEIAHFALFELIQLLGEKE